MTKYAARLDKVAPGMGLSVQAGALQVSDRLDIRSAEGQTLEGTVVRASPGVLAIATTDGELLCRPWHFGDRSVGRFPGTSSMWTVAQVVEPRAAATPSNDHGQAQISA